MTSQQKTRYLRITVSTAAVGSALIVVLGWAMPNARTLVAAVGNVETRTHANSTYARLDSLKFWRQRDSLNYNADLRDVHRIVAGLDSSDRCRRGQAGFCR